MDYTYEDINSGVQFTSVKLPQTLFNEGPLGIKYSENGNNSEGQKGIKYNGNRIESVVPFINAVDIDWNGANVGEDIKLNTTGDLLNWIQRETINGKSAYEIAVDNGFDGTEQEWLNSLKGQQGLTGNDGVTPNISIGTVTTVNSDQPAEVVALGTDENVILHFKIPRGPQGEQGPPGESMIDSSSEDEENPDSSEYATKEELNSKQDILVSQQNIRGIKYGNTPGLDGDWRYISLLNEDNRPRIDTSNYSNGGLINMSKVAFSGQYTDLLNRPDDDKYTKIFRKSLRDERVVSYPDKDSIQRVVYECVPKGFNSVIAKYQYGVIYYTEEQINTHNQSLPGAILPETVLLAEQQPNPNPLYYDNPDYNIPSVYDVNSKLGTSYVVNDTISEENANKYNSLLDDAWDEYTPIENSSPKLNIHGEQMWIQNRVNGKHSIAVGWGNNIGGESPNGLFNGKSELEGNHSFTEGKLTTVYGDYSHASGYSTNVWGDYSYGGGINTDNGIIKGNYSLGYGKNVQTFNNGEVAFGNYNESTTISELRRPTLVGTTELVYDNKGNSWKVIDFYNITLNDFEDNINLDFGDFYENTQTYDFGYKALTVNPTTFEITYNEDYPFNIYSTGSGDYTTFIHNIFEKNCNIISNYNDIYGFLTTIIYDINYNKSIYTYKYEPLYTSGNPGLINSQGCVVGVIAQKVDELGNPIQKIDENNQPIIDNNNEPVYEYDFFIWGPNSLYYEHEPITMLSFGNGNENERHNLIEITDDGNIHYANGESSLFTIENKIKNLSNSINHNVENISSSNSSFSSDSAPNNISYLQIPINENVASILFINNSEYITVTENNYTTITTGSDKIGENVYLKINIESTELENYYKKVIILNTNCYNTEYSQGNSYSPHIYFNFLNGIICTNNVQLNCVSFSDNYIVLSNFEDKVLKIELEVIQNTCFIDIKEYNEINTVS